MYYPEQRLIARMARLTRQALLPDGAEGRLGVTVGKTVDMRDRVAQGRMPSPVQIIEAAAELRLRNVDELDDLLLVQVGSPAKEGTVLAGKDPERGRRVFAPTDGFVVFVGDGRIIFQERPEVINIEAGVRGKVEQIYEGRGVSIAATGAIVQGVWGNGHSYIATMRMEPEGGIQHISLDSLDATYRNEILVTKDELTTNDLRIAEARQVAGIIAPSMAGSLLERAKDSRIAIMLTEGFGDTYMNTSAISVLDNFDGFQVTLDAYLPQRFDPRRPAAIINRTQSEPIDTSNRVRPLRTGQRVRINRAPHQGETGTITALPILPMPLANGLRVPVAEVELINETVLVPLANLELAGA